MNTTVEIFPLKMKLSEKVYQFSLLSRSPFYGLPGLVSDSLPDSFGIKAGLNMEIKKATCKKIIKEVKTVVDNFETYALNVGSDVLPPLKQY